MNIDTIIHTLPMILTTSRQCNIAKLYNEPAVETSNVNKLLNALKSIDIVNRNDKARVTFEVSHDEVLDIKDTLMSAVEFYKQKYKVRNVPTSMNIYQLISALEKVDTKSIVKDILLGNDSTSKVMTKEEKIEAEKIRLKAEMRIDILQNK